MTDLVYSKSTAGGVKRVIDLGIMGMRVSNSDRIDLKKEDYLKNLIRVSSNNTIEVQKLSSGLQFFFIIGGAEGFLDKSYETVDASRIEAHGTNTHGATTTIAVDDTCLLAVFDHLGTFVSSAVLRRPLIVKSPPVNWEESDATAVVAAWDKAKVGIYRNENFEVKYYGIWVNDSKHYYTSGQKTVDFHKEEATNGCIFIRDVNTPPMPDRALSQEAQRPALNALNNFEPELIQAVQAKIGTKVKTEIGTMRVVKVSSSLK